MHPATREPERVYNESESSSDSRVDGSRFRLALSNDPPLSCHSVPLGPSLITSLSLSSRYLLLSSHPPTIHLPSLVHPQRRPLPRAASGVTLNSGPAAMCPTTRADVDKARPMHGVESKESLAKKLSMAQSLRCGCKQLSITCSREAMRVSIITKITNIRLEENCIVQRSNIIYLRSSVN